MENRRIKFKFFLILINIISFVTLFKITSSVFFRINQVHCKINNQSCDFELYSFSTELINKEIFFTNFEDHINKQISMQNFSLKDYQIILPDQIIVYLEKKEVEFILTYGNEECLVLENRKLIKNNNNLDIKNNFRINLENFPDEYFENEFIDNNDFLYIKKTLNELESRQINFHDLSYYPDHIEIKLNGNTYLMNKDEIKHGIDKLIFIKNNYPDIKNVSQIDLRFRNPVLKTSDASSPATPR